ncbi:isoprenyl transferase [Halanaerocella petrolearia]
MWQLVKWVKNLLSNPKQVTSKTDFEDKIIPQHIAVIMDGNGRWAKSKSYPRSIGHKKGVDTLKKTVEVADEVGVEYITAYAFSTENWKRPQEEVDFLMDLFEDTFQRELDNFKQENIKVNIIGRKDRLPESVLVAAEEIMDITADNDGLTLNIALDYGGQAEIIKGVQDLARSVKAGELQVEEITEERLNNQLYTASQPAPDLLIRPGGEKRISNFLVWQIAYAELYFTDVYWPDFGEQEFITAIKEYQKRERRFGGLQEE